MNILLVHANISGNKGDVAILAVSLSVLKEVFPRAKLLIETSDYISEDTKIENASLQKSFLNNTFFKNYSFISKYLSSFGIYVSVVFSALCFRFLGKVPNFILKTESSNTLRTYIKSDLVIASGGGYLSGRKDVKDSIMILVHLFPILVASILNKPIILFPQSVGPFGNFFQKYIVTKVLKGVRFIFAREEMTKQTLLNMGISNIEVVPDLAFYFVSNLKESLKSYIQSLGVKLDRKIIGITVRPWFQDKNLQKIYEGHLVNFIENLLIKEGYQVLLIPQVVSTLEEDDESVLVRIYDKLKSKKDCYLISANFDAYELKALYENLDFLVGTRMHSNIFALSSYVPCLVIEYEYKSRGMMQKLGLEEWVLKIDSLDSQSLYNLFQDLENKRDIYQEKLKSNLENLLRQKEVMSKILIDAKHRI